MATCDPQTLLNDGSCFLCLSEKELNVAVAQLLCDIASGGVPCACENLGGADSPLNNITPDFIGQVYVQDSGVVWQAGSLLSSSWTVLCDPSGGGGGMIWGPDATELDFFLWFNGTFPDGNSSPTNPITTLSFPSLTTVLGTFDFDTDAELTEVSAPKLQTVGNGIFGYDCNLLTSVDFGSLESVTTDLDLSGNNSLTVINLDSLVSVTGNLNLYNCPALPSIFLPALTSIIGPGNVLNCSDNTSMAAISLPLLSQASIIYLYQCALSALSLPSLLSIVQFLCYSNQLTTLDLPLLGSFDIIDIHDNHLVTINAPNLVAGPDSSYLDASNNALNAATVAFLLHVVVTAAVPWGIGYSVLLDGGTNAGLLSLSVQGQADYATLVANGVTVTINP